MLQSTCPTVVSFEYLSQQSIVKSPVKSNPVPAVMAALDPGKLPPALPNLRLDVVSTGEPLYTETVRAADDESMNVVDPFVPSKWRSNCTLAKYGSVGAVAPVSSNHQFAPSLNTSRL